MRHLLTLIPFALRFAVGYGLSEWIGFGVYFISAGGSESTFPWRFPLAFQAVPALIMLVGSPWLPYSPRWLMQKSRFDEAEAVLKRLHARKTEQHDETAIKEFYQMKKQLEYERQIKADISWYEVFKTPSNRKRALLVTVMMWGNMVSCATSFVDVDADTDRRQFTGVIIIANYAVILFEDLGIGGYMPLLLLAIWITASFPGNVFTALFVDKLGRRKSVNLYS